MYVFNTVTVGDRTYGPADLVSAVMPWEYGLPEHFYGGRIHWIGRTNTDVLLLIERRNDRHIVIDTGAESLAHVPIEILRSMCDQRSIPYRTTDGESGKATTHKELQKALKDVADVTHWGELATELLQAACDRRHIAYRAVDEGNQRATSREELIRLIESK